MRNYQQDLENQRYSLEEQLQEAESSRGWSQILLHYGLNDHIANRNAVKSYCDPLPISLGGFKAMLANPHEATHLDLTDDTKRIINEIIGLLRDHGSYSEIDLKNQRAKLRYQTKQQIRARLAEVQEKQRLAKLSSNQIRKEIQASRPAPQPAGVLPPEITKQAIHAMPSPQIRKLIRDWGASVVNDRIFGRS